MAIGTAFVRTRRWAVCTGLAATLQLACTEDPAALTESAREKLARRDPASAIISLKATLQAHPDHAEARLLLGQMLFARHDAAGALVELERAQKLGLGFDRVAASLGEVWLVQGRVRQVVERLGPVQAADPRDQAEARRVLALAHLRLGEIDRAQAAIDAALQALPQHLPARVLALRLQAMRGQDSEALAAVEPLLQLHADEAELWQLKGDLLRSARRPSDEVAAAYRKALELQPDRLDSHAALIGLAVQRQDFSRAAQQVQAMLTATRGNAQAKYLEASVALVQGDLRRARDVAQLLLRAAPEHPRLLFLSGLVELRHGAVAQAETLLGKAVAVAPEAAEPRHALAEALVLMGRPARAVDVLAPLTAAGTRDSKALALRAQAHLLQGEVKLADELFARAGHLAPDDAQLRTARVAAQLGRGRDAQAMAELGELARTQSDASADYALVAAHLKRGQVRQALAAADALAAKLPGQPMPELLRGQIALKLQDRPAARSAFENALAKDPTHMPALGQLVKLDLADGKPEQARKRLSDHLMKRPTDVQGMLAMADLLRRTAAPKAEVRRWLDEAVKVNPADASARLAVIDELLRGQDVQAALQAAAAADEAIRDTPDLVERLGLLQLRSGAVQQAVATLQRLVALRRDHPPSLVQLAQAHEMAGQAADARQRLDEAIRLAPDAVPPYRAAVSLALRQGDPERALALARAVQQRASRSALGFELEGDVESARQRWPAAVAAYRKAVALERASEAAPRLYTALWRSGQPAAAEAFERSWRRARPDDSAFVLHVADVALARGDRAGAESRYREVLARRPGDPWALNNLALMLIGQRPSEALELARRAVASAPQRADVRDTLAHAHAATGELRTALLTQLEAVLLAPESPTLRVNLIRLYLRAGRKEAALEEIAKLQRQQPQRVKAELLHELQRQASG